MTVRKKGLRFALAVLIVMMTVGTAFGADGAVDYAANNANGGSDVTVVKDVTAVNDSNLTGENNVIKNEEKTEIGEYELSEGWLNTESGDIYYIKDGEAVKSWQIIEGSRYYFGYKTGKLYRGWHTIGGQKYYMGKTSGKVYTGLHKIKSNVYTFDEKGVLIRTVYGDKKAICLTYDDGPSDNTLTIANALKENNGLATFFVVGNRVSAYKKTEEAVAAQGHQIGNHTYAHKDLSRLSSADINKQVSSCNNSVKSVTGSIPKILRTPGGANTSSIRANVKMPIILWNVDTLDWKSRNADAVYKHVMSHVSDGSIILMHDLYKSTADASVRFIPELAKKGYQFVTIEEMALLKGVKLKAGKVYTSFK